ncbi:hypothetical protein DES53_104167 [Roseimicrobium gellanilyticum]|uniref:Uncharacterized protein n=1 Tax=Roseimicrobium gellanilyticum TaxID=748857 RepID=A0A366HMG6_9BACT|nr:hypothetical protein [Roseimicrobium gellanilyticum]RBP44348.1 hypothetical protein DES53_104167 [Roseimicrobium gellanilyticum]
MAIPADLQLKAQKAAVTAKLLKDAAAKGLEAAEKVKAAEAAERKAGGLEEAAQKSRETASKAAPKDTALDKQADKDATAAEQARTEASQLRREAEEAQLETEALYKAAQPESFKSKLLSGFNLGVGILIFVGAIVTVMILSVANDDSALLTKLAETDAARGLVTFLITASAVGIAFMLIYHAFSEVSNAENFRMAREIFMSLVGILGTIVGFYFGAADKAVPAGAQNPGVTLPGAAGQGAVSEVPQIADIVRNGDTWKTNLKGGTPPYKWALTADASTGIASQGKEGQPEGELTITVPGAKAAGAVTLTVEDSKKKQGSKIVQVEKAGP